MRTITLASLILLTLSSAAQRRISTDVLVIGGGTGGTSAGIQSARVGARTVIAEPTPWLGGMISAAGVSAVDGNHRLPSGIWKEFRSRIYSVYGGAEAVATGWVSNTQFEPHVADSIFKSMARAEKNLQVLHGLRFEGVTVKGNRITAARFRDSKGETVLIDARTYIDGTELGDVVKSAGVPYDLGMEAGAQTGEKVGVTATNDIVQDLTYVAVLKDYAPGADRSIARPADYDPAEFDGACTDYYHDKRRNKPNVDALKMLDYGRLPHNKFMINWPLYGNDTYLNIVELSEAEREKELVKAKETTRRFVYFIQHELGLKNLGYADDEFPSADSLALMPYHREGRRGRGLVRFTMRHIAEPFSYGDPLYRTGISVGDYPIDHHHKKNPAAPQHLEFYPIPSFNVPLGALVPQRIRNLVLAEKNISVSNVANGTTRLQPCVLLTGQAAGMLAALSAKLRCAPGAVPVRQVQTALLDASAFLMPYLDVAPDAPYFRAVQKAGASGILRGTGVPFKWANQTWFYPDSFMRSSEFIRGLNDFKPARYAAQDGLLTTRDALANIARLSVALAPQLAGAKPAAWVFSARALEAEAARRWQDWGLADFDPARPLRRWELARLLESTIDPFRIPVEHTGKIRAKQTGTNK